MDKGSFSGGKLLSGQFAVLIKEMGRETFIAL
jgi:hypothetical protein